jgi:hypothetical protein
MESNDFPLGWACRRKLYRATVQNEVLDSEMDFLIQARLRALLAPPLVLLTPPLVLARRSPSSLLRDMRARRPRPRRRTAAAV